MPRPGIRTVAAYAALLALVLSAAGCAPVDGEPVAQSPGPSPQPTAPSATAPSITATSTPPETAMPPGRQPPLPNASDVEVQTGLDALAALSGASTSEVADYAATALAAYGWTVTRSGDPGDTVVAGRTDVQPVTSGAPFQVVTAPLDSPADVALLLTVAHAFRSRSTHLPTVFVAQGATSYVEGLPAADRAQAVPVELDLPDGAGREELQAQAVELVTTL